MSVAKVTIRIVKCDRAGCYESITEPGESHEAVRRRAAEAGWGFDKARHNIRGENRNRDYCPAHNSLDYAATVETWKR